MSPNICQCVPNGGCQILLRLIFLLLGFATSISAFAAGPAPFSSQLLSDADRLSIQSNHTQANLLAKFNAYKPALIAKLGGTGGAFAGITNEGLGAVFATVVSYEMRAPFTPLVPGNAVADSQVDKLLDFSTYPYSSYGMICGHYAAATIQLFYRMFPSSTVKIVGIGVGQDSYIGNHVTLSAFGAGVPLFLDPTTSIIANGSLFDLLRKQPLTSVRFSERNDHINSINGFGASLTSMISGGLLDYRSLVYAFNGSYSVYTNPDFIERFVAVVRAGQTEFWFINTYNSSLWLLNSSGIVPANSGDTADIVAVANGVQQGLYMLTRAAGDLWYLNATAWTKLTSGVKSISGGLNGQSLYYINASDAAWIIDASSTRAVNSGNTKSIVTVGEMVYMLTNVGGQLYESSTGTWSFVGSPYAAIAATRPPYLRPTCSGASCSLLLDNRGQAMRITGGVLQVRDVNGNWVGAGLSGVVDYRLGLRGVSVNILSGGSVWRYNVPMPGIAANRFYSINAADPKTNPYRPADSSWNPALSGGVNSIGYYPGFGNLYLLGIDVYGAWHSIFASIF